MPNLATWFTPSLQVLQRSKGRNAVAAAAYRSCTRLDEEQLGTQPDFRSKTGHVSTELFAVEGLKLGLDDIGTLWNKAERAEVRKNSAVARELMLPLPHEWTDSQRRLCVRGMSEMLVARYGVAVMASIHRPANGQNDHVHILFTTREVDAQMNFGKKTRILDDMKTGEVKKMREEICRVVNEHAAINGADWYVYAGKFAEVEGWEWHIPTAHIPINAPRDLRETMEAENLLIAESLPDLKRIMEDSKEMTAQVEIALQFAASVATRKQQTAKVAVPQERTPNPVSPAPAVPMPMEAQIQASALSVSLDLRHAYREVRQAHARRKEGREVASLWRKRLRELEEAAPGPLVSMVAKMVRAMGVKDNVAIYDAKVAEARGAIEKCRKNDERFANYVNDPERKRKYQEWQQWPEHRNRVAEYEATLPDAPRVEAQPLASSWDGPYTLSPQQAPKIPEPWSY